MTRQITDQPQTKGATRLREFTRHERESGTHPAIEVLRTRPQMRGEENRMVMEFARIERGQIS